MLGSGTATSADYDNVGDYLPASPPLRLRLGRRTVRLLHGTEAIELAQALIAQPTCAPPSVAVADEYVVRTTRTATSKAGPRRSGGTFTLYEKAQEFSLPTRPPPPRPAPPKIAIRPDQRQRQRRHRVKNSLLRRPHRAGIDGYDELLHRLDRLYETHYDARRARLRTTRPARTRRILGGSRRATWRRASGTGTTPSAGPSAVDPRRGDDSLAIGSTSGSQLRRPAGVERLAAVAGQRRSSHHSERTGRLNGTSWQRSELVPRRRPRRGGIARGGTAGRRCDAEAAVFVLDR